MRRLFLPMSFALCSATGFAQGAQPTSTPHEISFKMLVHVPAVSAESLRHLLLEIAELKTTQDSLAACLGIDGDYGQHTFGVTTIVPQQQMIVTFDYRGDTKAGVSDAAGTVAKLVQERLQTLLYRPVFDDLTRQLARAEDDSRAGEDLCAKLASQLAELGGDDLAASQLALADLQQKLLDVELERRTEEAMQARLQTQMEASRRQMHDNQNQRARIYQSQKDAQLRLEAAMQTSVKERGTDFATQLKQLEADVRQLQIQLDDMNSDQAHSQSLYNAAAGQLTDSTLALQRHLSRKQVLEDLIARQQKLVEEAMQRSRQRQQVQRQLDAARVAADAAGARRLELRRQRDALEPVQVTPWK